MIGVMALIILGPERLPKVARTAGMWIGKARSMMREVKADIKTEMDAAEMDDLKNIGKDISEAGAAFKSQVESVDKNVQSEASEMDKAIGDALSKDPLNKSDTKAAPKTSDTKPAKSSKARTKATPEQAAHKKESSAAKTSAQKASPKKATLTKTAKKKTAKKKTAKKKVAKKKATKASSDDAKKA